MKISTALFVCFVFVFRLMFWDFSSLALIQRNNSTFKPVFQTNISQDQNQELHYSVPPPKECAIMDFCEAITDKEVDFLKDNALNFVQILYASFAPRFTSAESQSHFLFTQGSLPKRDFLSLSILRI